MKKFLIIGNANAITYKEVFPLIAGGEIFVRTAKGTVHFVMYFIKDNGEKVQVPSVWYTNLDSRHLYKTLELTKTYDPAKYPRYDNYDAIEVSCIKDIPKDYDGVMGVPISIVLFSPEQFKILGCTQRGCHNLVTDTKKYDDFIEMKPDGTPTGSNGGKTNENANIKGNDGKKNYFINKDGYMVQSLYSRIFAKHSHPNPLAGGGKLMEG